MYKHGSGLEAGLSREERISLVQKKLDIYHNRLANDMKTLEEHSRDLDKIITLGNKIKEEQGLDPVHLLLWHRIIGSSLEPHIAQKMELDTPGGDIEKLIEELSR